MRLVPKTRKGRTVLAGASALLAVGGVVGAMTLGDDGPEPQLYGSSGGVAVDAVGGGGSSAQAFTPLEDLGAGGYAVDEAPMPVPAQSSAVMAAPAAAGGGSSGVPQAVISEEAGAPESLPPVDAGQVVKSATLSVDVGKDGFERAHDKALRAVETAGGFVQSSEVSRSRASLTVRVPADRFEDTLTRLRGLGKVKDEGVSGQDVTEEYVDLDARLQHWKAQEAVFIELLGKANSVAETVEVRRELSSIQQTIEQLEGRIRYLDDRTGFSTISLEIRVPGAPAKPEDDGSPSLSKAWGTAWDAGVNVIGGTIVVLGALLPLSVIVGLPGLALWRALRRRTPAPTPSPTPAV